MAYRASLGGAFGGGAQRQGQAPQIDVASIIDSLIGAKASLTQQAILRAKQQRESEMAQHQANVQDEELSLRKAADARQASDSEFERRYKAGEAASHCVDVTTGTYNPDSDRDVVKERTKRSRLVDSYVNGGLPRAKAEMAADNPSLASYLLGFHEKEPRGGAGANGLTPQQESARAGLAAVNTQSDNTQSQLNRTPLPSRPKDQDGLPMEDPNPSSRTYQRHPEQFARDTATVNTFKRDSTAVAGKRRQLETKLDSLGARADTLSAEVQGRRLGAPSAAPSTARGGAAPNAAQAEYDKAAAAFKAGPQTPERTAKYNALVSAIAKKHGQAR
jgi:hypothetical protein